MLKCNLVACRLVTVMLETGSLENRLKVRGVEECWVRTQQIIPDGQTDPKPYVSFKLYSVIF